MEHFRLAVVVCLEEKEREKIWKGEKIKEKKRRKKKMEKSQFLFFLIF
jgi:hypothetical protein